MAELKKLLNSESLEFEELKKLLNSESSELAKVLRFSLYGMKASFEKAKIEYPSDPGISICQEFVDNLDSLLDIHSKSNNHQKLTTFSSEERQADEFKLKI